MASYLPFYDLYALHLVNSYLHHAALPAVIIPFSDQLDLSIYDYDEDEEILSLEGSLWCRDNKLLFYDAHGGLKRKRKFLVMDKHQRDTKPTFQWRECCDPNRE